MSDLSQALRYVQAAKLHVLAATDSGTIESSDIWIHLHQIQEAIAQRLRESEDGGNG